MNSPSVIAALFKLFFRIPGTRKYYFGLYNHFFKPFKLFRNQRIIAPYDQHLKIHLRLDEWIQQQIYFFRYFDERGIRFMKQHLKPGDVFMDVGANIGCYSLIASGLVGNTGKVYAFEAIGSIGEQLQNNLKINQLNNVVPVMKAVYEKSDKLKFFIAESDNMGTSSMLEQNDPGFQTVEVDAVTLDDFVAEHAISKVSLIKIDIEGAELYALKGMKQLLLRYRPVLIVEISEEVLKNSKYTSAEIIRFLTDLSYECKGIDQYGMPVDPALMTDDDYCNFAFIPVH